MEHFADVLSCRLVIQQTDEIDQNHTASNSVINSCVNKVYDLGVKDLSHLIPPVLSHGHETEDYIQEVSIDPDNILSDTWKEKFLSICKKFSHVITPRPGRYNGFYGRVDNSINFATVPPPSIKARLPKYSQEMLKILGDKMDVLEKWGVLVKPEDIGVVPEFVLPSMLTPKTDSNDWRLVTDFTALNVHIRKLETTSPTIKEAKEKIGRVNYHIQLDLSNYYYQGGMQVHDCQYLATPHPFKGLRVYACEPQGLKNAGEHAYERLGRIYGDLCAADKMTRMADGLFVLADTLQELSETFSEVLLRAELCGLTFKPSKLIIVPEKTVIFGWNKNKEGWSPTSHTISPLIKASPPATVKQARSWIGSFKQLTECIPRYAPMLSPLETAVAGRSSSERIEWTDTLNQAFVRCKKALNDVKTIQTPKPSDVLHTFSDFSKAEKAVGGRLEIHRMIGGKIQKLPGGHFSCRVSKLQEKWYPCEGEALAVKLVLEHFADQIRESNNVTIHHTDNQPVVQAWKRSKLGAFSTSARISTFLTGISAKNVEIVHTPGRDMNTSDYNSRNPQDCEEERCKICSFASGLVEEGNLVAKITVQDIENGNIKMPFTQRKGWLEVQKNDKTHRDLVHLMKNTQLPERKKTNGCYTTLKRLHNLYKRGYIKQSSDGLITMTSITHQNGEVTTISVPSNVFPGLIQALHLKLGHPSKMQLQKLCTRYFYCPGFGRIIEEVTSNCSVCAALKVLPKEVFSQSTTQTPTFGANFSSDVIRRDNQKILLTRAKLSQFTITRLIQDETADTLETALLTSIMDFIPDEGATIQLDNAPGWQTLHSRSTTTGSMLKKLNIKLDLGRVLNINKNPIAENAIKEFHKERLRVNPKGGPVSVLELAVITKNINSRIRLRGLSSKEIAFQRDQVNNKVKPVDDEQLSQQQ